MAYVKYINIQCKMTSFERNLKIGRVLKVMSFACTSYIKNLELSTVCELFHESYHVYGDHLVIESPNIIAAVIARDIVRLNMMTINEQQDPIIASKLVNFHAQYLTPELYDSITRHIKPALIYHGLIHKYITNRNKVMIDHLLANPVGDTTRLRKFISLLT